MHILDQTAPGLAEKLQMLSTEQRRRALLTVCKAVCRRISDLEPDVLTLLEKASVSTSISPDMVVHAQKYAELSDDRYFTLQEKGEPESVWSNWFSKARLGTAIAKVLGTTWEDSANAAYELCFVGDDKHGIVTLLRSAIDAEFCALDKNN